MEEWLATDIELDRPCLVRVLGPESTHERRTEFLDAVRTAAAISHLHLAHVYEAGDLDDGAFSVSEWPGGIRLSDRESADRILLVVDGSDPTASTQDAHQLWPERDRHDTRDIPVTIVHNKCDLSGRAPAVERIDDSEVIELSAKTGAGLDLLKQHLKECMGYSEGSEGNFSARRRHLQALELASDSLEQGRQQLLGAGAGELLAEDLRLAHKILGEITGAMSSDEMLGEIFSSFCIGK